MRFNIPHGGGSLERATYDEAIARGIDSATVGDALKAHATALLEREAEKYRAMITKPSGAKQRTYEIKERIASDPASASARELELIDAEATARGTDRATLLAEIAAKATATREVLLLIDGIEAKYKIGINGPGSSVKALPQIIQNQLNAAKAEAEAELPTALALLNGGN